MKISDKELSNKELSNKELSNKELSNKELSVLNILRGKEINEKESSKQFNEENTKTNNQAKLIKEKRDVFDSVKYKRNKKWKRTEKKVAKIYNGRLIPGSGSPSFYGGDVETDTLLIECKQTDKESRVFKLSEWDKIKSEAFKYNKCPVLIFDISGRLFEIKEIY